MALVPAGTKLIFLKPSQESTLLSPLYSVNDRLLNEKSGELHQFRQSSIHSNITLVIPKKVLFAYWRKSALAYTIER